MTRRKPLIFYYGDRYVLLKEQSLLAPLLINVSGDRGHEVEGVVIAEHDKDNPKILRRGLEFKAKSALTKTGESNGCHRNSARFYQGQPKKYDIVTGFAGDLDSDNLMVWRPHTWLYDKEKKRVVETTTSRDHDFGFVLDEDEAEDFVYWNT
jgi:hypothetical protein